MCVNVFWRKFLLRLESYLKFVDTEITSLISFFKTFLQVGLSALIATIIVLAFNYVILANLSFYSLAVSVVTLISITLVVQSLFFLFLMVYTWDDPKAFNHSRSPRDYEAPHYSFTALLPARHEETVIAQTIKAVATMNYPENLKETIVIVRCDDEGTIREAQRAIAKLQQKNVRLVIFDGNPINKPHGLNIGLREAVGDVVTVFDSEDEPHKLLYQIVNTVMLRNKADVVQSGVQLVNFRSSWFSLLNVLEYFFWFKSFLHYFSKTGLTPLGGNTVFFKRSKILAVGGWDETNLTEDADIGIRLSIAGAKIKIVYDEEYATQEETPPNLASFIKQRTRWDQGFLQTFLKGNWRSLPKFSQRFLAAYILLWPEVQTLLFLYIPVSLLTTLYLKLPLALAILSIIPAYLLLMQMLTANVGLYEFTRKYNFKYSILVPIKLFITFIPYQLILGFSALRATIRLVFRNTNWEKTAHVNAHRVVAKSEPATEKQYAPV